MHNISVFTQRFCLNYEVQSTFTVHFSKEGAVELPRQKRHSQTLMYQIKLVTFY
jgi:hypothetical protein